jgi:hypothetical protein
MSCTLGGTLIENACSLSAKLLSFNTNPSIFGTNLIEYGCHIKDSIDTTLVDIYDVLTYMMCLYNNHTDIVCLSLLCPYTL